MHDFYLNKVIMQQNDSTEIFLKPLECKCVNIYWQTNVKLKSEFLK